MYPCPPIWLKSEGDNYPARGGGAAALELRIDRYLLIPLQGGVYGSLTEHRHSKLRFVTPEQRHNGEDAVLLEQRKWVLEQAKQSMPSRWGKRPVRNCDPDGPTTLNPEKELPMKQAA